MILFPLKEWYKTIRISTTSLERFVRCPRQLHEVPFIKWESLEFWTKAHKVLQHFMYNREHYAHIYELFVEWETNERHKKMLSEYLDLAEYLPEQIVWEEKFEYEIEAGNYKIVLVWKIDCIDINFDLADYKTSKSKRKEWSEKDYDKLQPLIYTYCYRAKRWVTEWIKKFHYHIFSKHKRDACKFDTRTVEVDLQKAKQRIERVIKEYIIAYVKDIRKPKRNLYCKWCKLYDVCKVL